MTHSFSSGAAIDPDYGVFATVVDARSLSAAARRLAISPAMVSKRLARLEARLGVRLLHRTTRRLSLTEAGARFHAELATILRALTDAEARLTGDADTPAGTIRVSAPTSFGRLHVAPHLHRFLGDHPRVSVALDLDDAPADLFGGQIDLAIRITADVPPSLTAHRLAGNRRILCASAAYLDAAGAPDTLAALQTHRLLAAEGQSPWRLVRDGRSRSIEVRSHVRTNSSEVVRELALSGVGIALRSLWDVADALAEHRLIRVLPSWEGPGDLAIHAVHPRSPTVPAAVTAFVDFLRSTLASEPWNSPDRP